MTQLQKAERLHGRDSRWDHARVYYNLFDVKRHQEVGEPCWKSNSERFSYVRVKATYL